MSMSSARVSSPEGDAKPITSQEEDLLSRSTKKVKDLEEEVVNTLPSYKDRLLTPIGGDTMGKMVEHQEQDVTMSDTTPNQQPEGSNKSGLKGPVIPLSDEELALWSNPWKNTLVVNVLGKRVNYRLIENKLNQAWTKNGSIQIIDMHDGYFQVVFKSEEDYKHALFEGPWKVADHYLIVQRWRPLFLMNAQKTRKVAVWIRIPKLPIELYNDTFLRRIGMQLGNFLKVDRLTSIHSRGKYARICVELDLDNPLESHIVIRGCPLYLEYEGLHTICFRCGRFGHKKEQCREIVEEESQKQEVVVKRSTPEGGTTAMNANLQGVRADVNSHETHHGKNQAENQKEDITPEESGMYGPWMIAKQNLRRRSSKQLSQQKDNHNADVKKGLLRDHAKSQQGSRFAILVNDKNKQVDNIEDIPQVEKEQPDMERENAFKKDSNLAIGSATQPGPQNTKPMQDPSTSKQQPKATAETKHQITQCIRNQKGGRNPRTGRGKEIKLVSKHQFKKKSNNTLTLGKVEEGLPKELKGKPKQHKKEEEKAMLERMQQLHLQQLEKTIPCSGWAEALPGVQVHVDWEAIDQVEYLRRQAMDAVIVNQAPQDTYMTGGNHGCKGSKLPPNKNISQ